VGAGSSGIIFDDLERPPNRGFTVTGYLQVEYLKNGAVIGNHTRSIEW